MKKALIQVLPMGWVMKKRDNLKGNQKPKFESFCGKIFGKEERRFLSDS